MKTLLFIILILLFTSPVYALDTSVDTSKQKKIDKEKTLQEKKSKEKKESEGEKTSKTIGKGLDKQTQEAIKQIGQAMHSRGVDVVLPLEILFLNRLSKYENDTEPFTTCKIITHPKLPADFELTAEIRPGIIDTIKASYISNAVQSRAYISNIADEDSIRDYRNCLAVYGAIIGQAYLYLTSDITELEAEVSKDDRGNIIVSGLNYADFTLLANTALSRAISTIEDPLVKDMYQSAISDSSPCQFDTSVENIKCGNTLITLTTKPGLMVAGIKIYGDSFSGFQGSFKVSRGWSYSDAIEKLKSTSAYSKFADEISKYTEELESQGRSKEATLVKKKAWELAQSGKQAVSLSQFLPSIHQ